MARHRSHNQWVLSVFWVCAWLCILDVAAVHFVYHGPNGVNHWSSLFEGCGGRRQSSVGLDSQTAIPVSFGPLEFVNYGFAPSTSRLLNNGHADVRYIDSGISWLGGIQTSAHVEIWPFIYGCAVLTLIWVQVFVSHPEKLPLILRGGGLLGDYELLQYHFHWGLNSTRGSEHTIDDQQFAMEMHLVHYKKEYETPQAAMNHHDGIAVVAVLFTTTEKDNQNLAPLVSQMDQIKSEGEEYTFSGPLNIMKMLPENKISFYRYAGSLTTPICQEIVVWTIFDTPIPISEKQLIQFRKINGYKNETIADNFRPTQDLNGRTVFLNEPKESRIRCRIPYICSVLRDLLRVIHSGDRFNLIQ